MATDMSMSGNPRFEGWGRGDRRLSGRALEALPYRVAQHLDPVDRASDARRRWTLRASCAGFWQTVHGYTRHDQTTIGVGVRYDFAADNMALKLQVDRIDAKRSSALLDDRGFVTGPRSPTVFSATLDFVF